MLTKVAATFKLVTIRPDRLAWMDPDEVNLFSIDVVPEIANEVEVRMRS